MLLITIRPSVARYQVIFSFLRHLLQSYDLVVGTSTNQVDNAYRLLNPSSSERFNCVIDLVGDQPILCQRRLMTRKLVSNTRLTLRSRPSNLIEWCSLLGTLAYVINLSVTSSLGRDFSPDRNVPLRVLARYGFGEKSYLNRF